VERQAESCSRHAPAYHVFLAVLGTHMDAQFHRGHRKTEADSGDNQVCQLPPNSTKYAHDTFQAVNCYVSITTTNLHYHIIRSHECKLITFQAILLPFVSCSNATGKSPRS